MSQIPSISDAFKVVVAATEAAIIADTSLDWGTVPKKVYFMQGPILEITNVLQSYTNSPDYKNKKYPLVILIRDFKEQDELQLHGIGSSFKPQLLIITLTNPTYRSDQREENNFKPILRPIYAELLNQLSKSKLFGMPRIKDMKPVRCEHFFYGTSQNNKNIFNDFIDAIEIESIALNIKNFC